MAGGRPNKTKELKILEGNYRPWEDKGRIEGNEILSCPEAPDWLNDGAAKYFKIVVDMCINMGTMKIQDLEVCASLAHNLSMRDNAARDMNSEKGYYITTQSGYEQVRPCVTLFDRCLDKIIKYTNILGLNPLARERLRPVEKEPENELTKIIELRRKAD